MATPHIYVKKATRHLVILTKDAWLLILTKSYIYATAMITAAITSGITTDGRYAKRNDVP